jgi:hypothetical protein
MLRKLALLLIPLFVFAAACGGDDNNDDGATNTPEETATEAATSAPTDIPTTPTPLVIATQDLGDGAIDFFGASGVLRSVNPFQLLDSFDGASEFSSDVDPALKNELITAGDLPSGFLSMGEFTFAAPSEYGEMQMAATIFASGDITSSGELGTMVMSASIVIPPDAMDEFSAATLDEIRNLSDEDLASALGGADGLGALFSDLRVLDGSGLGDGGVGIHMVMDFGWATAMLDAPEDSGVPAEMAMDMFMFVEGDRVHMAVVMYAGGRSPGVDARHLADVLDSRVGDGSL